MSAQAVVALIRDEDIEHRVVSEDVIAVIPRKVFLSVIASHVRVVDLAFEDGPFARGADIGACGLIAP